MAEYYSVKPNGRGIYLVGDFATQPDAQAFADLHGVGSQLAAIATLAVVFLASPTQASIELDNAKSTKIQELNAEAIIRLEAIDPLVHDLQAVYIALLCTVHISPTGLLLQAVGIAAADATVVINAFVDINDVNNYDVVNDPAWP